MEMSGFITEEKRHCVCNIEVDPVPDYEEREYSIPLATQVQATPWWLIAGGIAATAAVTYIITR